MSSRPFNVVLLAMVTVLGLSFANAVSDASVRGMTWLLKAVAFQPMSSVEAGVARRLAEWGTLALAGLLLGVLQARVLRLAGLRATGWVMVTALGLAVGLVGGRALVTTLGWSQAMAPLGLGLVMGLAQGSVLRREVHGAEVWLVACVVGYGMAGPAAAWGERTREAALAVRHLGYASPMDWTTLGMAVVSLAVFTAIGGSYIFSSLRTQVLPGPRSRLPGAVSQLAVLGVLLPLLVAMEARALVQKRDAPRGGARVCDLPLQPPAPFKVARDQPRVIAPPTPDSTGFSPGCTSRGCGSAMAFDDVHDRMPSGDRVIVIEPPARGAPSDARGSLPPNAWPTRRGAAREPRAPAPVVHDEHLHVLTPQKIKVQGAVRWNNAASRPSEPLPPSTH
ncbi:hypothetical protein G4177_18140 [Corallococcus sp. ZKHCc1 1396]|uniref:Uncharacterized protein n=1 Tax=Corallococcus soli TaxID=2710757 RepID=A0ABR9PQF4_9BACT|nr:hypothetical protein [Corallococcus soli]MBE4750089.1 hypothetical protein [Corallococcus soli]